MEKVILLSFCLILLSCFSFALDLEEFIDKAFRGTNTYSSQDYTFEVIKEFEPGSTMINRCVHPTKLPIQLGGKTYARGIGTHADSHIKITLKKPVKRFLCNAGVDSQQFGTPASVRSWIIIGDKEAFRTGVIKGDNSVLNINLPFDGANTIELFVDSADDGYSCDQWDWADARVEMADGSIIYLDEMFSASKLKYRYPFSFNYGGKSSDDFLHSWDLRTSQTKIDDTTDLKTFIYTDPETGLEVKVLVKYYRDAPAADWTIYFTNRGDKNSKVISDLNSLETQVTTGAFVPPVKLASPFKHEKSLNGTEEHKFTDVEIYKTLGTIGWKGIHYDDFKIIPEYLEEKTEFRHTGLMPSEGELAPYWTLKWSGGGIVIGLGWTGNWSADFIRDGKDIKMSAGLPGDKLNAYLKPGEHIRSPRVMIAMYEGNNVQIGFNMWRRAMINHITPKKDGKPAFIPFAYSLSGKEMMNTTAEIDMSYIKSFIGMGFEVGWMDAWYTRDKWPNGIGNYHIPVSDMVDPQRYPEGLTPLVNMIKSNNMDVMIWFGPETVWSNTFIAKEHPEYVMFNDTGTVHSYALVNQEAREYMLKVMDAAIKEWQISIYRTDSGTDEKLLNKYVGENAPDRLGIAENRYIEASYEFWDELVKRNPGLLIDNCCAGGTRLDLELMSRTISLWRSDSNVGVQNDKLKTATLNQAITANLNNYIPWTTGGSHGPEPYFVRSGYNTGFSFVDDTRMEGYDKKQMMKAIKECERLRKYALGNFNLLFQDDSTPESWCVWQYHRPKENDGYFVAFRREEAVYAGLTCFLKDIDENKKYRIKIYRSYDLEKTKIISGRELKNYTAVIDQLPGSLLVEYSAL